MTKDKMTVTELRSKIYQVTKEVHRTGKACVITDHGEEVCKLVPIKKKKTKAAAEKKETIWEKFERLGPRNIMIADDIENFSVWDEAAWERKWDKRLGRSSGKKSKK